VVVDLCYEKLIYDDVPHNLPRCWRRHAGPDGAVRIGVQGVRDDRLALRVAAGARAGRAAAVAIQSHSTSNVTSITQKAARRGADRIAGAVKEMLDEYRRGAISCTRGSTADPRLRCRKPAGAFYMFVDIGDVLSARRRFRTSLDFADALLESRASR
jgi:aspartate aminotransferase